MGLTLKETVSITGRQGAQTMIVENYVCLLFIPALAEGQLFGRPGQLEFLGSYLQSTIF